MEYSFFSIIIVLGLFGMNAVSGFVGTHRLSPSTRARMETFVVKERNHPALSQRRSASHLNAVIDSSSVIISSESWRQYVPLVVSCGIIIDILLGSPLANMALKPMRPDNGADEEEKTKEENKPRSKARIDAELIAQQALDKANSTMELRNFLEERKTDYDRMEEMKRKLDSTMQELDEDMEARQKSIDARKDQ